MNEVKEYIKIKKKKKARKKIFMISTIVLIILIIFILHMMKAKELPKLGIILKKMIVETIMS